VVRLVVTGGSLTRRPKRSLVHQRFAASSSCAVPAHRRDEFPEEFDHLVAHPPNCLELTSTCSFLPASYLLSFCPFNSCSPCGHQLQITHLLLDCPESKPLRRVTFGTASSSLIYRPDLGAWLDCWGGTSIPWKRSGSTTTKRSLRCLLVEATPQINVLAAVETTIIKTLTFFLFQFRVKCGFMSNISFKIPFIIGTIPLSTETSEG